MSYAENLPEHPADTFENFSRTRGWANASEEHLAADFFCMGNESNLDWDPCHYEEREGKLYDPKRKNWVVGSANGDTTEENVNVQLQDWFLKHDSGIAIWISPRDPKKLYFEEKLVIYRIGYEFPNKKIVFVSSHLFKTNFRNPEDIRKFIFTEDDKEESVFDIINWLTKISQKPVSDDASNSEKRRSEAQYFAQRYRSGISASQISYEMTQSGFLGNNPINCRNSIENYNSSTFRAFGYSDEHGSLEFECHHCHAINTRPVGKLLSNCQFCGGDVRC